MPVFVFPRLAEVLAERGETLETLAQEIESRFGLHGDRDELQHLGETATPVQQTDMAMIGAIASYLAVPVDDLFEIIALPIDPGDGTDEDVLDPVERGRLRWLFDERSDRPLT